MDNTDEFIEQLIKFADFNEDRKVREGTARDSRTSIASTLSDEFIRIAQSVVIGSDRRISLFDAIPGQGLLAEGSRFVWTFVLSRESCQSTIAVQRSTRSALIRITFASLDRISSSDLAPLSDRPNWYQRVRIAIGIIEFVIDTSHFQDGDEQLHLCSPLLRSFGYQDDFESRVSFTAVFIRPDGNPLL